MNKVDGTGRNKRGIILIATLLLAIIIAIFSTSLFARVISERRLIETETNRMIAFHLAESGVDEAIAKLADDANYSGTGNDPILLGGGSYSTEVTTPDPALNPKIRKIFAKGFAPSNQNTSYAYQERIITTYVQIDPVPLFTHAVSAQNKVTMLKSSKTDSYNSTLGPYGGNNVGSKGAVASNVTEPQTMAFKGNTVVSGDVIVGPQADPAQVIQISDNATIQGTQKAAVRKATYDPVTIPPGLINSGDLSVSGNDIMLLPTGTYWYHEIRITGSGKLTLAGPVIVYADGNISIPGGSVITAGNIPANFMVKVVGDKNITISGKGSIYGVFYAPESGKYTQGVQLSNSAEIFGGVVAYEFQGDSGSVHYDEALQTSGGTGSQSDIALVSWQES